MRGVVSMFIVVSELYLLRIKSCLFAEVDDLNISIALFIIFKRGEYTIPFSPVEFRTIFPKYF
jgi:hypothetical protein